MSEKNYDIEKPEDINPSGAYDPEHHRFVGNDTPLPEQVQDGEWACGFHDNMVWILSVLGVRH